jgi:hypothetical protein
MEAYEKETYIKLVRFIRRNRKMLNTSRFNFSTAENISRYLFNRLGYLEIKEIINQLIIIEKRKGSTGQYLITLLVAVIPESIQK